MVISNGNLNPHLALVSSGELFKLRHECKSETVAGNLKRFLAPVIHSKRTRTPKGVLVLLERVTGIEPA